MKSKYFFFLLVIPPLLLMFYSCVIFRDTKNNKKIDKDINLIIDVSGSKYKVYKDENKFKIDVIETEKSDNTKKSAVKTSYLTDDLFVNDDYKIGLVGNMLFILYENVLYGYEIPDYTLPPEPIGTDIPETPVELLEKKSQTEKVGNIYFDSEICFYVNNEGKLFIYDVVNKIFIQYHNIVIPQNITSLFLVKAGGIAERQIKKSEDWHVDLSKKIMFELENNATTNLLSGEEEILFYRYSELKRYNSRTGNKPGNEYMDIQNWYDNFYVKKENEKKSNIDKTYNAFKSKWRLGPDENLFSEKFELPGENNIGKANFILKDMYNGNDKELNFLVELYSIVLDTYNGSVNIKGSADFIKLMNDKYKILVQEMGKRKNEFETAKSNYSISDIDDKFEKDISNSLNSLIISSEKRNGNFDYILLKPNDGNSLPGYILLYKELAISTNEENPAEENSNAVINNNRLLGVYDGYFYVCEKGELTFYDVFTLKKEDKKNVPYTGNKGKKMNISLDNETVQFILDHKNNIIVTQEKMTNKYFLRSINVIDDVYRIMPFEISLEDELIINDVISNKLLYSNIVYNMVESNENDERNE